MSHVGGVLGSALLALCGTPAQLEAVPLNQARVRSDTAYSMILPRRGGAFLLPAGAVDTADPVGVIVELSGLPLARQRSAVHATASLRALETAERRFEHALAALVRPDEAPIVRVRHRYSRVLHGAALTVPARLLPAIAHIRGVRRVHLDSRVTALIEHSVPEIGAPEVWARYGARGEGVIVAVIDTGVDYGHPALGGGFGPGFKVIGGYDFANDDGDPADDNGHGTHVAGIIAADGEGLIGVAPGTKLLAYKVLDGEGLGDESDVIAALEAAVDPNGDGDTSDHVGVVNLSLGSRGGPDDADSLAADAAVEAGVVVCAAAGNEFHELVGPAVGSPAAGRRVVAVGASDGTLLADFSSWGPTWGTFAIKPEVVAPGVGIRSAAPGCGTAVHSGTSMASPHVAGLAALLRAIHPDWSPELVASAMVTTATDLGLEVMGQGSGRVNASAAAATTLFAEPITLNFGVDTKGKGPWSASRTLRVSNAGTIATTLSLSATGVPQGAVLAWEPSTLSVEPGGTGEVALTLTTDGQALPPAPQSMSFGGLLTLMTADESIHVPWAFIKSARLHVLTPGHRLTVFSPNVTYPNPGYVRTDEDGRAEYDALVPEGVCYLLTSGAGRDTGSWTIVRKVEAEGESTIEFAVTEAKNHITLAPGSVPSSGSHATEVSLLFPSRAAYIALTLGTATPPLLSDISQEIPVSVTEWRGPGEETDRLYYRVTHPPLAGLTGNAALGSVTADRYAVSIEVPEAASQLAARVQFGWCFPKQMFWFNFALENFGFEVAPVHGPFDLFVSDEAASQPFVACTGISAACDSPAFDLMAGPLRAVGGRLASLTDETAPPTAYWVEPGGLLSVGGGLHRPALSTQGGGSTPGVRLDVRGPVDEVHAEATAAVNGELKRLDGSPLPGLVLQPAPLYGAIATLPPGLDEPVKLLLSSTYARFARADALAKLTLGFDPRLDPLHIPSITSLMLLDSTGRQVPSPQSAMTGAVVRFSAIGCTEQQSCTPLDESSASLRVKWSGASEWRELPLALGVLDLGTRAELGHFAVGRVFEARVPAELLSQGGGVDLLISIANASGARTEWLLEPAFEVKPPRIRRRKVTSSR